MLVRVYVLPHDLCVLTIALRHGHKAIALVHRLYVKPLLLVKLQRVRRFNSILLYETYRITWNVRQAQSFIQRSSTSLISRTSKVRSPFLSCELDFAANAPYSASISVMCRCVHIRCSGSSCVRLILPSLHSGPALLLFRQFFLIIHTISRLFHETIRNRSYLSS